MSVPSEVRREFPDHPIVGVGGVVIHDGRALLIRRGHPPLEGQWSIPGGALDVGETLVDGVARELAEETGLDVEILDLIEVVERIQYVAGEQNVMGAERARPQYHYVIVDYLCRVRDANVHVGSDAKEFVWVREDELTQFKLTPAATLVIQKAFAMVRDLSNRKSAGTI